MKAGVPQGFGVWIDYNRDKDFTDAGEFVYASPTITSSLITTTVTIPATAVLGTARLRIRSFDNSIVPATASCSSFSSGEAEDYTITISALPTITSFAPVTGPAGSGIMIKGSNFISVSSIRFNNVPATTIYNASTTLTYVTVPPGTTTGKIQVQAQGGSISTTGNFTIANPSSKWNLKKGPSIPRIQHGVLSTRGKIFLFGGKNSTATVNLLSIYTPETNTWVVGPVMPVATSNMAVAVGSDSLLYKFGGITTVPVSSVLRFSPSTNTWTTLANMPAPIFEAAAAATANGKIYVFGGKPTTASGSAVSNTRIYTIATNSWTSGASLPVGVYQHSAITGLDGKIYIIGGRSSSSGAPVGLVQIYNPTANTWSVGAAMPIPKVQFGATRTAGGLIYIIGGKATAPNSTGPYFHTVEVYNPATNTWSTTGPILPRVLGQQMAVNVNDNLYAVGGTNDTVRNYNYLLVVIPSAPSGLTATAASSSRINLKWKDKALNETGQVIERATVAAGPFTVIATLGSNTTTYSNTALSANTTYYYRIKSINTGGSSTYSNVASAKNFGCPCKCNRFYR